jgi:hypothetical protein
MLLSPVLTWLLFFIALIAFIVIVTVILKKRKVENFGPWALTAIGLLFAVPILFSYWLTHAFIIENSTTAREFCVFGKPVFTFKNGSSQPIAGKTHTIVVNNMDSLLVYETLHYGKLVIFGSDSTIPPKVDISPYTIAAVSDDIDYLLMPDAPSSIRVKNPDKTVSLYWLHVKGSNITKPSAAEQQKAMDAILNAEPIEFPKAFDNSMNDKMVKVEGYFSMPEYSYQLQGSVRLNFYERKNQFFAFPQLSLLMDAGDGNNAMQPLPKKFKPEDVKIKTDNGSYVYPGERISVIGELSVSPDYYRVACKKVEKIPGVEVNYGALDAVKLNTGNMTDANLKGRLVSIEGEFEIPSFVFGSNATNLDLSVPGINKKVPIAIAFGNGAGKLQPLPGNFSPADVKIHDDRNRVINLKRKVLVYGVWDGSTVKAESINNL